MSYRKRSIRRRRNTDKWEVAIIHADELNNAETTVYRTVQGKTKGEAQRACEDLMRELNADEGALYGNVTISTLADRYLDFRQLSGSIEASTLKDYRKVARWVKRFVGTVKMSEVSVDSVAKMTASMTEAGYAPRSVIKTFRLLSQMIDYAVVIKVAKENPCRYCKPPKAVKSHVKPLPKAERTRMLNVLSNAKVTPVIVATELALSHGVCRGEVCGLRLSDFDEGTRCLSIERAIGECEGGHYVKCTKASSRERTFPLTDHSFEMLRTLSQRIRTSMEQMGLEDCDLYLLGTVERNSRFYSPAELDRDFAAFCEVWGFDCTFHGLRHSFATMMVAEGEDVRTVAYLLGHSNPYMTLNVYAEVDPDAVAGSVDVIDAGLGVSDRTEARRNTDTADGNMADISAGQTVKAADDTVAKLMEIVAKQEQVIAQQQAAMAGLIEFHRNNMPQGSQLALAFG